MSKTEAIELAIDKATAAEVDVEYFTKVHQTEAYQTDESFQRQVDAALEAAQAAVAFHQAIKVALTELPD